MAVNAQPLWWTKNRCSVHFFWDFFLLCVYECFFLCVCLCTMWAQCLIFTLFLFMYTYVSLCVCATLVCGVPEEVKRCQIPQSGSYKQLWATMRFLGINPGSFARAASALNFQAIAQALVLVFGNRVSWIQVGLSSFVADPWTSESLSLTYRCAWSHPAHGHHAAQQEMMNARRPPCPNCLCLLTTGLRSASMS